MKIESGAVIDTKEHGCIPMNKISLLELAIEMNHRTNSIMDVLEFNQTMIVKMQSKIIELETALLEFL
jgi:hypothetical protein